MRVGHQEFYRIKMVILSPVHVGTGDEIEPLEYIIKDKNYYRIDFQKYVSLLSEAQRKELEKMSREPSVKTIMKLRTFLRDKFQPEAMRDAVIEKYPVNTAFEEKYNRLLNEFSNSDPRNQQINQLSIMEIYRSGNFPVVPGSSIKGSIRTALLDTLLEDLPDEQKMNELNSIYFKGDFDPFDSLRVSDFVRSGVPSLEIGYFVNSPAKIFDKIGFKQSLSVIGESLSIGKAYRGDIRTVLDNTVFRKEGNPFFSSIRNKIKSLESLFKVCNDHYLEIFEKEFNLIKTKSPNNMFVKFFEKNSYLKEIQSHNACLLRIGRHSGAEAVTIKGRKINVKTEFGCTTQELPNTVWYFCKDEPSELKSLDNVFPCGWVLMKKDFN